MGFAGNHVLSLVNSHTVCGEVSTSSPSLQREFLQRLLPSTASAIPGWGWKGISFTTALPASCEGTTRKSPGAEWVSLNLENCRLSKLEFWTHLLLPLQHLKSSLKIFYPKVTVNRSLYYLNQLLHMCTFHSKITLFKKKIYRKGNNGIKV